jgi:hypothetical protein
LVDFKGNWCKFNNYDLKNTYKWLNFWMNNLVFSF